MVARSCFLVLAAGLSVPSQASFDLMLIQAAGTDATGFSYNVHRYDPVNRVNLGTFSIGPRAEGMAVSRERNELYAIQQGGQMRVFDYNTGVRSRVETIGGTVLDAAISTDGSSIYYVNGGDTIWSYGLTSGTSSAVTTLTGSQFRSIGVSSAGNIFVADSNLNRLRRYQRSGSTFSLSGSSALAGLGPASGHRQMAIIPDTAETSSGYVLYRAGNEMGINSLSVGDVLSTAGGFSVPISTMSSISTVVHSHNGAYVLGVDVNNVNGVAMLEVDEYGFFSNSSTLTGVNGAAYKAAIVLAPEPGTMIALGAGLAALLRRRRAK